MQIRNKKMHNKQTDSELLESIKQYYLKILERSADTGGLEFYFKKIKNNEIRLESLLEIFQNSPEYTKLQQRKKFLMSPQNNSHASHISHIARKIIDDITLFYDTGDKVLSEIFSKNEYEKATTNAVMKLVKPGMNVINIGANIGYFTLLMARQVGPTGKVFAFEPSHNTVKFLQKNVDVNGYTNVEIHAKAVSNKNGKADFWIGKSSTYSFLSEMKTQSYSQLTKVEVEITTIDDFFREKNAKIDFIMMDAEGSEKYILEGSQKALQNNPDIEIITEYNPFTLKLAETDGKSFLDMIEKLGFSIFLIDEKDGKIKPTTKAQILANIVYPNLTNLYLTKKSDF